MRGDRLLLYLAVLLVVAGGYFFLEARQARQEAKEKAAKQVFQLKASDISALTLKSDKGEIQLKRAAAPEKPAAPPAPGTSPPPPPSGDWEITKPISVKADDLTIHSLLSALADLKIQRALGDLADEKKPEFGLDKPVFVLEFQASDQTHRLRFGRKVPGDQNFYAQKDDEPKVLMIRIPDKETLDRNLTALRTKKTFTLAPDEVSEIRLIRNQERLTLQRTGPAEWKPGDPVKTTLRADRINALLGQITGTKAVEFVAEKADDLKKYGLAPSPSLRLTVLAGSQEETLLLGGKQGERYYAQISGTSPIFLVDQSLVEKLPTSYEALEDRRVWTGQDAEIQKLTWGPPDTPITAVRDKNGWTIQAPEKPAQQVSATKFGLALWRLKDLEFSRILPAAEGKKEKTPVFSLRLFGPEDKVWLTLEELAADKDQIQATIMQGEKTLAVLLPAKALTLFKETLEGLATTAAPQSQEKKPEASRQ